MFIPTKQNIKNLIQKYFILYTGEMIQELESSKYYILVLPEDISVDETKEYLTPFLRNRNIVVLHASNIKLLELS